MFPRMHLLAQRQEASGRCLPLSAIQLFLLILYAQKYTAGASLVLSLGVRCDTFNTSQLTPSLLQAVYQRQAQQQ